MINRKEIKLDPTRRLNVDKIDLVGLSFEELVITLEQLVNNHQSFLHVRYGDGENLCMFQCFDKGGGQNSENIYYLSMADRMLESAQQIFKLAYRGIAQIYIGSPFITWPEPREQNIFINYWHSIYKDELKRLNWCQGDFWYYPPNVTDVETKNILRLFDTIRNVSCSRKVVFVSNANNTNARHCLGAEALVIPGNQKGWGFDQEIQNVLEGYAKENALFIWCAGMPGKVWMAETFLKYPETAHIDIGSFFDLTFGVASRGWMTRKRDGQYTVKYEDEIIPYVKSFILG